MDLVVCNGCKDHIQESIVECYNLTIACTLEPLTNSVRIASLMDCAQGN